MRANFAKRFIRGLALVVVPIMVFVMLITFLQRQLIYYPMKAPQETLLELSGRVGFEPVREDDEIIAWQTPLSPRTRFLLLVFHGNAGYALHRSHYAQLPPAPEEWQAVLAEYPGYGARAGKPSELALYQAAEELLERLQAASELPIFVIGESIGTGVAAQLAASHPDDVAGLLLITPMTSLADVAARHYRWLPVRLLVRERYDAAAALQDYNGPVAFVVAGSDEIMPAGSGRRLFESYRGPRHYMEQPQATHNSLDFSPREWAEAFGFLKSEAFR